jgi:hypothetical protein
MVRVIVATITVWYEDGVPDKPERYFKNPGYTAKMEYGYGNEVMHCREEQNPSTPVVSCLEFARDNAFERELLPR